MSVARHATGAEMVPIADRLRYMQALRLVMVAAVAVVAWLGRDALDSSPLALGGITVAYVAMSFAGLRAWRVSQRGGRALFDVVLIVDGLYLAWVAYVTGGAGSPLRYLIIVHLIAVALLASYRTGMKLALWHSLLLLVVFYAQEAGLLRPFEADSATGFGSPLEQLLGFSAVFWCVAIVTSSFSAISERELRRRRYDMEALATMAAQLEEETRSRGAARVLVERAAETFDLGRTAVLAAKSSGELDLLAVRGDVEAARVAGAPPGRTSVVTRAMDERRTMLLSQTDAAEDAVLAGLMRGARHLILIPLSAEKQAIGVLVAEYGTGPKVRIERRVLGTLERFAAHGALALRNAWLLEEVQQLAATDALTGLANRAVFQDALAREAARAGRDDTPLSLVLLDVDHFKAVNDTYGHQVGDEVLRRVARHLDRISRAADLAARYGGEEFAVVLPGATTSEAAEVAERLRAAIEADETQPRVTASLGVATLSSGDPDALIRAADDALYAAKGNGRNRVEREAAVT